VSYLRRISTRSLIVLVVGVLALSGGGAAIAVAAGGGSPTPPPAPLDQAIRDALAAKSREGVTARIEFRNNLLSSGGLAGPAGSALLSGASGRLWADGNGRGRVELQSDAGDAQIVWNARTISVYDASSNTVYRASLPARSVPAPAADKGAPPTAASIDRFLAELATHWALSAANPIDIAGRSAYSVSASPKHDGGLLDSVELAWDASQGAPLRARVYARDHSAPALELAVKDISYGSVPTSDVAVAPPAGARVVDLGSARHADKASGAREVTGLDAAIAAADFPVVAPDSLVGLPRQEVRLLGGDAVVVLYGRGLGTIAVVERKADASPRGGNQLSGLPSVSIDGLTAHELATQLGTVIAWQSGGTSFVLAGSRARAAAVAAARALK